MDELKGCNNVFVEEEKIYTKNLDPGKKVYDENLVKEDSTEYRGWNPYRSKLAAAIKQGLSIKDILHIDSRVLYLGAASGTTVSHVSDIAIEGEVYAVEFSPTIVSQLLQVAENRENMIPLLEDARRPEKMGRFVPKVDLIYQDVAQPDQADILIRNSKVFLKEGGYALLALKAQAVSSSRSNQDIYQEVTDKLGQEFEVLDKFELDPYDKDHLFLKLKKLD